MTVRLSPRVVHTNIPITIAMFVIPESGEERTEDEEREKRKEKERKKERKSNGHREPDYSSLPFILSSDGPALFAI